MTEGSNVRLIREALTEAARAAASGQLDCWLKFFSEEIEDWMSTVDGIHWEIGQMTEVGDSGVVADTRIRAPAKGTDSPLRANCGSDLVSGHAPC